MTDPPRSVLDILGADPNLYPEPLSFVPLGEGARQHNAGKAYSGCTSVRVVSYLILRSSRSSSQREISKLSCSSFDASGTWSDG